VAGLPVVVTRDLAGTLHAFRNVCSHKATQVASGCGAAEQLVCPYHGWAYELDGTLQRAPRLGSRTDFDRATWGLKPLGVCIWGPFVLVHRQLDAPHPSSLHPELDAALTTKGWGELRWVERRVYDVACNWKAFCDNYLDGGYHIAHMHPSLAAQLDLDSYRTELFERCSVQTSGAASMGSELLQLDPGDRIGTGSFYAFVYPNLMLNRYGPALDSNLVLPKGPDRCDVIFDFFFDESVASDQAFVDASVSQSETTQREDMSVSESVQVGLRSGAYETGPYAAAVEQGTLHFHQLVAADLRAAVGLPARLARGHGTPAHGAERDAPATREDEAGA
jgi:choline monooxygenase